MVFHNKIATHFAAKHPNQWTVSKTWWTCASAKTCTCSRFRNFLTQKRALVLLFALWQIFCICLLESIFLSRAILNTSAVSDYLMVCPSKDVFFSIFWYFERNMSQNFDELATISLSLSHYIAVFVSISSLLEIVSRSYPQAYRVVLSAKLQISIYFMKRSRSLIKHWKGLALA